ncbi:hydrophobic protein [Streptodolium elevatio]
MLIWIVLLVLALVLFGVGLFTMPIVWIAAAVLLAIAVFGGGRSRRSSRR